MGEANRVKQFGPQARVHNPNQPIQVDLKNATPKVCQNKVKRLSDSSLSAVVVEEVCGCDIFIPVVKLYTISALVSPTGQELLAQQPVLCCKECGRVVT